MLKEIVKAFDASDKAKVIEIAEKYEDREKVSQQIQKLQTIQNTGAISSVASILATVGFLTDQWAKIQEKQFNDNLYTGRKVKQSDLKPYWYMAFFVIVLEILATVSLYIIIEVQILKVNKGKDFSERKIPENRFNFMKYNILAFDYVSELVVLVLSATLFVYTEYTTIGGFALNIMSTLVDWYFSYRELRTIQELQAYTESPNHEKSQKIISKVANKIKYEIDGQMQQIPKKVSTARQTPRIRPFRQDREDQIHQALRERVPNFVKELSEGQHMDLIRPLGITSD